jgi:hypothetical protein
MLFFEKTIRHYVHIIYPRIFNWRNLPTSTSMSLSVSVSMDTDRDMDVDVDMGRWTRTGTCTWTWTWTWIWADPDVFRHFFHLTFFATSWPVFFPFDVLSRSAFFPFGVFSIRHFFHSAFFPFGVSYYSTFCPIRRFSIWCFVLFGVFSIGRFVPFSVLSFDVLSFDVLYIPRLLLWHFVGEPCQSILTCIPYTSGRFSNDKNRMFPKSYRDYHPKRIFWSRRFEFLCCGPNSSLDSHRATSHCTFCKHKFLT